ncbi:hypothetical protein [Litorisediminicola beolgyonensis]|uniref:DUF4333 domain-containing protein n=1 Tax=Litorisediminicola beolgyonensis TaxID=1173614 RepID=A0ABW3ZDZ3_9RHOB
MRRTAPLLLASLIATSAAASGPGEHPEVEHAYLEGGVMTYEVFESAVSHVDLAGCPAEFDPDAVFCRMALNNERAQVFVFSFDGNQPLLAVKAYDLDSDFLPF